MIVLVSKKPLPDAIFEQTAKIGIAPKSFLGKFAVCTVAGAAIGVAAAGILAAGPVAGVVGIVGMVAYNHAKKKVK